MRNINKSGIDLIKEFEGLHLTSYQCSAKIWTIGYGHTKGVYKGQTITKEQAESFLLDDIQEAQNAVCMLLKVPLNDNEYAALVSFVFNVGVFNFENSTLLKLLNHGLYDQVPVQLLRWNKVNNEVLGGLTRRRSAEGKLWRS